jgi:hypothetical protein
MRYSEIEEYFSYLDDLERRIWYMISNVNDLMIKNDIRIMSKSLIVSEKRTINIDDAYDYIIENGLDVFSKNNAFLNNILLMGYVTKLDLRPDVTIVERFKKLITFFDKTSSYTIQLIYDNEFKDTFVNNVTKNNLNLGYKPLMEVKDAKWYKYEQVNYLIKNAIVKSDMLDVRDTQVNKTYSLSRANFMPCLSIYDDINNIHMLLGNRVSRYRRMSTTIPEINLYEDNRLNNNYIVNTKIPTTHKKIPLQLQQLSCTSIGSFDNYFNMYGTFGNYLTNYTTRYGIDLKLTNSIYGLDSISIVVNKGLNLDTRKITRNDVVILPETVGNGATISESKGMLGYGSLINTYGTMTSIDEVTIVDNYKSLIDSSLSKNLTSHLEQPYFNFVQVNSFLNAGKLSKTSLIDNTTSTTAINSNYNSEQQEAVQDLDTMNIDLEVSATNRSYEDTVVETDKDQIEVDLTFEIRNK